MHPLLLFTLLFIPGIRCTSSPTLVKKIMVDYPFYGYSHFNDIYSKKCNDEPNFFSTPQINDDKGDKVHNSYKPSDNRKTDVRGTVEFYTSSYDSDSGKSKPDGYVKHSFQIKGGDPNVLAKSDLSFSGKTIETPNNHLKNVNDKFIFSKSNLNKPIITNFCPCCKKHSAHFNNGLNQKSVFCPCCKCSTKTPNNKDQMQAGRFFTNENEKYQEINNGEVSKNPFKINEYDDENIETSIQSPLDFLNPFNFGNYFKDVSLTAKNEGRQVRNYADKKLKALSQLSNDESKFGKLQSKETDLMGEVENSLDALSSSSVKKDKILDFEFDKEFDDIGISNKENIHSNEDKMHLRSLFPKTNYTFNNFQQPTTPNMNEVLLSTPTKKTNSDELLHGFDESSTRVENFNGDPLSLKPVQLTKAFVAKNKDSFNAVPNLSIVSSESKNFPNVAKSVFGNGVKTKKVNNNLPLNYDSQFQNIDNLINEIESNDILDDHPLTKDGINRRHVTFKRTQQNNDAPKTLKMSSETPRKNRNKIPNVFNKGSQELNGNQPEISNTEDLLSSNDMKPFDSIFKNVDDIFDNFEFKENLKDTLNKKNSSTENPLKPKFVKTLISYPPRITTKRYLHSTQPPQSGKIQNIVTAKTNLTLNSDDEDPHLKELTFWNRFKKMLSPFL